MMVFSLSRFSTNLSCITGKDYFFLVWTCAITCQQSNSRSSRRRNSQQNEPKLYVDQIASEPAEVLLIDMGDAQNEPKKEEGEKKVLHTYALVRFCDMVEEMRTEAMDLSANACEKHSTNNESAAKMIKENMDKKFGPSWHAVVGEGYGFEISYEVKHLMYMYFGGNLAICVWKCS